MKSPEPYFARIHRALNAISMYCPADEELFLAQQMIQDATLMRLQEIGENLARLRQFDEATFDAMAVDSWYKLIGLRNIISHGYHDIDPEQIWQIVTVELPRFARTLPPVP